MKTKRTITTAAMLLAVLTLLAGAAGCTALNLVQELKDEPGIMDAGIELKGGTLTCEVILEETAEAPAPGDTQRYAGIAARVYPGKTIILNVVQGGVTIASMKLES